MSGMEQVKTTTADEGFVETTMNYSSEDGGPIGYYFYEPEMRENYRPAGHDRRSVRVYDGWPQADSFSADVEGFEIRPFDPSFDGFEDDDVVRRDFYPQAVDFVKRHTGARMVVVFDHTLRRKRSQDIRTQTEVQRPVVFLAHSDFTPRSGPQRVRDIMGGQADDLLSRRVAFYNVWKPLYDPVEEFPLGLCDARTVPEDDFLIMHLKYKDRDGEIYTLRYSPDHRWVYFPRMTPDRALLLKTYDSETDGRARFMGHSAFADPSSPAQPKPRQSIEIRTMAFF